MSCDLSPVTHIHGQVCPLFHHIRVLEIDHDRARALRAEAMRLVLLAEEVVFQFVVAAVSEDDILSLRIDQQIA